MCVKGQFSDLGSLKLGGNAREGREEAEDDGGDAERDRPEPAAFLHLSLDG